MKVTFIDEYDEELLITESGPVPRVDDSVLIDEEKYYVKDVTWNINTQQVKVMLSETQKHERKEEPVVITSGLKEAKLAIEKADRALKETKTLRTELVTVRQFLKAKKK